MFDWITKPYIEWTIINTMYCYGEMIVAIILLIVLAGTILEIKDKIQKKWRKTTK